MKIRDCLPIMAESLSVAIYDEGRSREGRRTLPAEAPTMSSPSPVNRRDFSKAALAGTAVGLAPAVDRGGRVIGTPNDRVRIGCLGVGYRGVQVLNAFLTRNDAQIVALCDVYEPYLNGHFDRDAANELRDYEYRRPWSHA